MVKLPIAQGILCPELGHHPPQSPPDLYTSNLAYFNSIPWTAALLQPQDVSPSSPSSSSPSRRRPVTFIPACRNPPSSKQEQLLGNTLATENTIPHWLSFFTPESDSHLSDPDSPVTRVSTLCIFQSGVCGLPGLVHGGMIMAMLDEAMGVLFEVNNSLGKKGVSFESNNVTGTLETKFLEPMPLDRVVVAESRLEQVDGRKTRISCQVKDEDGSVLVKGSSIWVALRQHNL